MEKFMVEEFKYGKNSKISKLEKISYSFGISWKKIHEYFFSPSHEFIRRHNIVTLEARAFFFFFFFFGFNILIDIPSEISNFR